MLFLNSYNDMDMRLVLRDVGPIGKAELNLSGVVLLYGSHGAGNTTVARALSVASRLLGRGSVEAREATSLINCSAEKAVIELEEHAVRSWGGARNCEDGGSTRRR